MFRTTLDRAQHNDDTCLLCLEPGMVLHTESQAGTDIVRIATEQLCDAVPEEVFGGSLRTQIAKSDDGSFVLVREGEGWNDVVVGSREEIGRYLWDDADPASLSALHELGMLKLQLTGGDL